MRRFHGNDHRSGVEAKDASEAGACDAPIGPRLGDLLLQIEQQECPGAIHFDLCHQSLGKTGGLLDQHFGLCLRVQLASQCTTSLLHVKIRHGNRQQCIVPRRLEIGLAGCQFLAVGQRSEDGVRDSEVERAPPPAAKALLLSRMIVPSVD